MTLQEAIDLLTSIPPWPNEYDDPCYLDALKIGIEALKSIQKDRLGTFTILLPGETSE